MNRKVDHKIILAKKKLRKLSKNYKQNFKNIENYIKKEIYEIKRSNKLSNNIIPEIKYKEPTFCVIRLLFLPIQPKPDFLAHALSIIGAESTNARPCTSPISAFINSKS